MSQAATRMANEIEEKYDLKRVSRPSYILVMEALVNELQDRLMDAKVAEMERK